MGNYIVFVICILSSFVVILRGSQHDGKTKTQDDGVFKATNDWQTLQKDQAIPRGLHVRMNLQTGKLEAKLVAPDESDDGASNRQLTKVMVDDDLNLSDSEPPRQALHRLEEGIEREKEERTRKHSRPYSELKKERKKYSRKSDQQVIEQLVAEYKETVGRRSGNVVDRREHDAEENLLSQLEFLVHQIDNGIIFVDMNGAQDVVFPSLNSTSWKVRYEATKVFGSAFQNNHEAKVIALEAGSLPVLLRVLALDPNSKVKAGAMFALSALIRSFTYAQKQFLDKGGLTVIVKQFDSDTSGQLKIQLKAVQLIKEIIDEVREAESSLSSTDPDDSERYQKMKELNLWVRLVEGGWCQALTTLLSRHSQDEQVVEHLLEGMAAVSRECYDVFKSSQSLIGGYRKIVSHLQYGRDRIESHLDNLLKVLSSTPKDEL